MFKNYLKIAFRNLWRNKVYSFLNISGLAIGTAVCLMITLFVSYELSFDRLHNKSDRIYRLYQYVSLPDLESKFWAMSTYPMATSLVEDYSDIENYVRFANRGDIMVKQEVEHLFLQDNYFVDSTFFQVFDFPLLKGNPQTALNQPNSVVITEATAQKLFGDKNPMGESIEILGDAWEGTKLCQVRGVLKNLPGNSHLQFEALFSMSTLDLTKHDVSWKTTNHWTFTYLLLSENAQIGQLEKDFPNFLNKYQESWYSEYFQLHLQPLLGMHLDSQNITYDFLNTHKFNRQYVHVFIGLALLILGLASVNFINLSTARSVNRAKEIGIRKTVGAYRWQLISQLTGEAILFSLIAMSLAIFIVDLSLPFMNQLIDRPLSFHPFQNPILYLLLPIISIVVGILSGIYPALYISAYEPIKVLKGKMYTNRKQFSLRNVLVVGQFSIAIGLIVATLFVVKQLNFLRNRDVGFNKDQVLLVNLQGLNAKDYELFKDKLLENSLIPDVTAAWQRLGTRFNQLGCKFEGDTTEAWIDAYINSVDYNYFDFYEIKLLAGRSFSKKYARDKNKAYIINEATAKTLGLSPEEAIGKKFALSWEQDDMGTIIGVSKNFNHNSLHYSVEPVAIVVSDNWTYAELSIRLDKENVSSAIAYIEQQWNEFFPKNPFEFSFLDQHFEEVYQDEKRVSQVVSIFTLLAILVACLGLFGLAAFTTQQRTKEIGIRKVLGASTQGILALVLKDFVRLIIIAILIACPVAYWFIREWLQSFAFRVEIDVIAFAIASLGAILIASLTVLYHAGRSATTNPIEVLRNE